ncbi:Ig-like domain-containing protein [Bacillus sp. JJ1566]|uniref:InlB B-repeat-containing protein n=1 Tax=Bacillus sp. JJ1566 TaxID=3122961 RepID=UPI002FFDD004
MKGKKIASLLMVTMMILTIFIQPFYAVSANSVSSKIAIEDLKLELANEGLTSEDSHSTEVEAQDEHAQPNEEEVIVQQEPNVEEINEDQPSKIEEALNQEPSMKGTSTTEAPEGYELEYNESEQDSIAPNLSINQSEAVTEKRVLLIEDVRPWSTTTNDQVLSKIGEYDKVTTSQFLRVNLANYAVVVFANDQPFNSYENYTDFKEHLETFAELGGVIVFGAADGGWANGNLIEALPGGIQKNSHYEYRNYITDQSHPIVTGSLTDQKVLQNSELYENYTSHVSFEEATLPPGTKVILRETTTDRPTLIEYPLEKGRVIASGLTWEYNYLYGGNNSHPQGGVTGTYAQTAMEDMFRYAIRVSDISVNDLKILEELYLDSNSHHIVVASKETGQAISGVQVKVGDSEYITDENGKVRYDGPYEKRLVTVSKEGYRTIQQEYDLKKRTARFLFLEPDANDGLPYFTRVQDRETNFDLRSQTVRFIEGDKDLLHLKVAGDWGEESGGMYYLYQEGEKGGPAGKQLRSISGEFILFPGLQLNPEQPVKLKMVSDNNVSSEPITINLFIDEAPESDIGNNGEGLENIQSFLVAEEQQGSINNDLITRIFPGDFKLKAPSLPVDILKKVNDDGTVTYRGTIGIKRDNLLKKDTEWNTYKKDFDKAQKNGDRLSDLNRLLNTYGGYSGGFTIERKFWNPKVNAVGYIEVKQDKNGKILENAGGVILTGSNTSVYSQQFLYGPVPLYLDLTGQISISAQVGTEYSYEKEKLMLASGELKVRPTGALGGGLGVSGLATVGVEGGAGFNIKIYPEIDAAFETWAKIKAKLLFVVDWEYTLARSTIKVWPRDNKNLMRMAGEDFEIIESEMSLTSRDYAQKTTNWNGANQDRLRSLNMVQPLNEDALEGLQMLQDWIMPNSIPQFAKVDDTLVMLFHSDDPTREIGNHTVLMYSMYLNNAWSEPVPVWDSETADFFFQPFEYKDELYAVWQKSKAKVSETEVEDLLDEVTKNSEISFAKWNNKTMKFENQQFVTDNKVLDMYATLASNGKNLTSVWVSNSENDPLGESGTYSIMKSTLSQGKWSTPTVVYQTTDYITELSAGYVDEDLSIAYSVQSEEGHSDIYTIKDGKAKQISQNPNARALKFNDNHFYWHSDGSVIEYDIAKATRNQINSGQEAVITSSYQLLENEGRSAIVWHGEADGSSTVYASLRTNDGWSAPISLFESENFTIQYMDIERMKNGDWKMIMNALQYVNEDPKNSFIFANVEPKADTLLNDVYANEALRDGATQPIEFSVTNLGENQVNTLTLKMQIGDDVFLEKTIETQIKPGETVNLKETVNVSSITKETEINFSVYANEERDKTNNHEVITLGLTNVSLTLQQHRLDDKIIVTANVSNHSATPANVAIKVMEDSIDGLVLDVKDIGKLKNDTDYVYVYSIDLNNVNFNNSDSKQYYFKIETLETDLNEYDNSDMVVVFDEKEKEISDEPIEDIEMVRVTGMEISQKQVALVLDDPEASSFQLHAEIKPFNASNPYVKWTTSDGGVASVDQNGLVTATGLGTTQVTATTYDGEFVGTVDVTVSDEALTYSLKLVSSEGGSISVGSEGNYESGAVIHLTAKPDAGYRFKNWSTSDGGAFENAASLETTFTMPSNSTTVTANFELESNDDGEGKDPTDPEEPGEDEGTDPQGPNDPEGNDPNPSNDETKNGEKIETPKDKLSPEKSGDAGNAKDKATGGEKSNKLPITATNTYSILLAGLLLLLLGTVFYLVNRRLKA